MRTDVGNRKWITWMLYVLRTKNREIEEDPLKLKF